MAYTKYEEYMICCTRGHEPSGVQQPTIPVYDICKWCGTAYHEEIKVLLEERNVPAPTGAQQNE